jgi:methylmalonyl-CoA mutase
LMDTVATKTGADFASQLAPSDELSEKIFVIPPSRNRYLSEIAENNRGYDAQVREQKKVAQRLYALSETMQQLKEQGGSEALVQELNQTYESLKSQLSAANLGLVENWQSKRNLYKNEEYVFKVAFEDTQRKFESHGHSQSGDPAIRSMG